MEELVQNEVAQLDTTQVHPAAGPVLPLSSSMDRFRRPQQGEQADQNDPEYDNAEPPVIQGIDMSRYTDFHDEDDNDADSDNPDHTNQDRMYTALAYSMLRERNSRLALQNDGSMSSIREAHLELLLKTELLYRNELERKRRQVEDINDIRKKRQIDFQPINEHLEEKWHDGINSMIDMGIQRRTQWALFSLYIY